jgi:hypothetical protein
LVCLNPLEAFRIKSYRNQIQDEDELFKTSPYRYRGATNEEKNQDFVILIAIN